MKFVPSNSLNKLTELFILRTGTDLQKPEQIDIGKQLRVKFIDFLSMDETKVVLKEIAIDVIRELGLETNNIQIQRTATPRIYRPADHGTSIHTDYWYGHGESYFTIWIPLTEINEQNTFWAIHERYNDQVRIAIEADFSLSTSDKLLKKMGYPVLPPAGSVAVFSSKLLHGSIINSSDATRISLDFRIGNHTDASSNKDPNNFYRLESVISTKPNINNRALRFLKYINGRSQIGTMAQHIIIEGMSKSRGINIAAQEAEVERLGNPMLEMYVDGLLAEKGFDGIVIASKQMVPPSIHNRAVNNRIRVYYALENQCTWSET